MHPVSDLIATLRPDYADELRRRASELEHAAVKNIPARFAAADLDNTAMRRWATDYATALITAWPSNDFGPTVASALLSGPVGTGKTHTLWATVRHLVALGVPLRYRYTKHAALVATGRWSSERSELMDALSRTQLLLLDDLGTADDPDGLVARLVDERYDRCVPSLFTSNFPASQLSELLGDRTASRLAATCVPVVIDGKDRRRLSKVAG